MKRSYRLFALILLVFSASELNVQNTISQNITVCNIVKQSDEPVVAKDEPLVLYIEDSASNQNLAVVFSQSMIKKMSFNPREKLVNQQACISGVVKTYNNQPAIIISNEKQIEISGKPQVHKKTSNG